MASFFSPLVNISLSKSISFLGIFLNIIGGVFLAVDVLTSDESYLKKHSNILGTFFLCLFMVPTLYLAILGAVKKSIILDLGALFVFFICGAFISQWGDKFQNVILEKLGQKRAMGRLGLLVLVIGSSLQMFATVVQ